MRETPVRTVPDPDLEINKVGGGGGSHPDPEIRGDQSPKNFFQPFGPQFGLKIRGCLSPPGPSPRSATAGHFSSTQKNIKSHQWWLSTCSFDESI